MPARVPGPETTVASYYVIESLSHRTRGRLHGVLFNKGLSLLHHRLLEKGVDIRLPHYWYKHGDIVVKHWMPRNVQWPRPNEDQTFVYWRGPPPHDLRDAGLQKEIISEAESLGEEFTDDEKGIPRIVDEVYRYAPFDFQRRFQELFSLFKKWFNPGTSLTAFIEGEVVPSFEGTVASFPTEEFPDLELDLRKYAFVCRRLFEKGEGVRYISEGLSEDFWLHFCKSLRLHTKAHENVPDATIEIWQRERQASQEIFQSSLMSWVSLVIRELRISRLSEKGVKLWLSPESWGPESTDSSVTIDQTLYG